MKCPSDIEDLKREIDRLQEAKRRALQIADERAKEVNGLEARLASAIEECAKIAENHVVGAGIDPDYDKACRDIAKAIRDTR